MFKRGAIIVGLIALIVILAFVVLRTRPTYKLAANPAPNHTPATSATTTPVFPLCPDFTAQHLTVGGKEITVALADSPAERMHGLSGCPVIPETSGMYFVIHPALPTAFWMKNMLVPLDIVWIKAGVVTWIVPAAPIPSPGQSDATLTQYKSPSPVDAVLELPAGQAQAHGIKIGTTIKPL